MKRTTRRESPTHTKYRRNDSPNGRSGNFNKTFNGFDQGRRRNTRQSPQDTERRGQRQYNSPSFSRSTREDFSQSSIRRDQSKNYTSNNLTDRRSSRRSYGSSGNRYVEPNRNSDNYSTSNERIFQTFADRGGKIDSVFAAAAAAAAMNAGLVPQSTDIANLASNVSRNLCSSSHDVNSSATVAAVAAAAMNAAALAAAFGGNTNQSSFDRSSGFNVLNQLASIKSAPRHRSPSDKRSYSYKKKYTNENVPNRKFHDTSYRDSDRQSDASYYNRFPHHLDHKEPESDPTATRTLFIGNLSPEVKESDLREMFERYGILEDVDIKRPLPNSNSNAYAFLRYINLNMAHRAKLNMSGKMIGKFACKIGYGKVTPTRCLWIGNLGPWIKYPAFAALVERIGRPEKIIWPSGKNYAHILFPSIDAAIKVASTLRGYPLGGNTRKIRVDFTEESYMIRDQSNNRRRGKPVDTYRTQPLTRTYRDVPKAYLTDKPREHRHKRPFTRDEKISSKRNKNSSMSPSESVGHARSSSPGSERCKVTHQKSDKKNRKSTSVNRRPSPTSARTGSVTPCDSASPDGDCKRRPDYFSSPSNELCIENAPSIDALALCLPTAWTAVFVLKKSNFSCRMHIVRGDESLVDQFIPRHTMNTQLKSRLASEFKVCRGAPQTPPEECSSDEHDSKTANKSKNDNQSENVTSEIKTSDNTEEEQTYLRISQRMKMDPTKLDDVNQRIRSVGNQGFCVLLAMPADCDSNSTDFSSFKSGRPLRDLINYLATKDAAGVVLLNPLPSEKDGNIQSTNSDEPPVTGVLHVLPPCDFAYDLLAQKAINLQKPSLTEKFLVILLIRSYGLL